MAGGRRTGPQRRRKRTDARTRRCAWRCVSSNAPPPLPPPCLCRGRDLPVLLAAGGAPTCRRASLSPSPVRQEGQGAGCSVSHPFRSGVFCGGGGGGGGATHAAVPPPPPSGSSSHPTSSSWISKLKNLRRGGGPVSSLPTLPSSPHRAALTS